MAYVRGIISLIGILYTVLRNSFQMSEPFAALLIHVTEFEKNWNSERGKQLDLDGPPPVFGAALRSGAKSSRNCGGGGGRHVQLW